MPSLPLMVSHTPRTPHRFQALLFLLILAACNLVLISGATAQEQTNGPESIRTSVAPPTAPDDRKPSNSDGDSKTDEETSSDSKGGSFEPLVLVGQSAHLTTNETAQAVVVVFGSATIDGHVTENVVVIGGFLNVNGKVDGNVVNVGWGIHLSPAARVDGDVVGVGGGVQQQPGARIVGKIVPVRLGDFGTELPQWIQDTWEQCILKLRPLALSVPWVWVMASVLLVLYCLLGLVFPGAVEKASTQLSTRGTSSLIVGILAVPCVGLFFLILGVTVFLLPLLPFLFAPVLFGALIGKAGLLRHLGGNALRPFGLTPGPVFSIFTGGIILSAVYLIPVVGLLAWALTFTWSFGAMVQGIFRRNRSSPSTASQGPTPLPAKNPASAARPSLSSPFGATAVESTAPSMPVAPAVPPPTSTPVTTDVPPSGLSTDAAAALMPTSPIASPALALAAIPILATDVVASPVVVATPVPAVTESAVNPTPPAPGDMTAKAPVPGPIPVSTDVPKSGPIRTPSAGSIPPPPPAPGKTVRPNFPTAPPLTTQDLLALRRVGLFPRIAATALDWFILLITLHGPVFDMGRHDRLFLLLCLTYFSGFYIWKSTTPMGVVFGLKVVRLDGRRLDLPCVLVRGIAAAIGAVAGGLGYLWCAWDPEKQTWHDKLAGTVVVKTDRVTALV